jgi:hypothetical protein
MHTLTHRRADGVLEALFDWGTLRGRIGLTTRGCRRACRQRPHTQNNARGRESMQRAS